MSNTVFTPKPPAPAGRRELALAVVLLAGCLLAANGLYWGGLNLGLALALMIIIGATGLHVLTKTAWRPYAILCLAAGWTWPSIPRSTISAGCARSSSRWWTCATP